jgi:hypothetical protein
MREPFDAPIPFLTPAFALALDRAAPVTLGAIATGGVRALVSVTGGCFSGDGFEGRIVGGSELSLARADGVTAVEASYLIDLGGGALARCHGQGYRTAGPDFAGLRLALQFEAAQDGPGAALATRAFVAEQAEGSAILTVCRID